MPLYFAYGSNMHGPGFRARCPLSRAIGAVELPAHRFTLMATSGYASVRPAADGCVHGLLIDLDPADLDALDAYEDVAGGLYDRAVRTLRRAGGEAVEAIVYLGCEAGEGGVPPPGYMECIVAGAREAGLPPAYVAGLAALLPTAGPGGAAW